MNMLQLLTIILPIVALFCVLIIACINVFIAIRKHYPIKVNCWFCNNYSQVQYEERNSFYCSSCLQYNGFNEDGDYNKLIPEQHDEMLNNLPSIRRYISRKASNGLCRWCNNNQQLKVQQLSVFVPLNENTYDVEIEHFTSLLEKAYKLCPKCEQILHQTLNEQNKQLIGQRILSMHKNTMAFLDINKSSKHATVQQKKVFFNIVLYFTLILISTLMLIESIQNTNMSEQNIKRMLPVSLHSYISCIKKYLETTSLVVKYYFETVNNIRAVQEMRISVNSTFTPVKSMIKDVLNMNLTHNQYIEYVIANTPHVILNRVQESFYEIALTVSGLFLQFSTFLLRKHNVYTTVLWIFLLLISYIPFDPNNASILKVLMLFIIIYKTLKNIRLKSTAKKNSIYNKHSTIFTDSTSTLSHSDSSAINLSTSTNYFNMSSGSNMSFHDLNATGISTRSTRSAVIEDPTLCLNVNASPTSTFGSKAVLRNPLFKSQSHISYNKTFPDSLNSFKSLNKTVIDANDIQSSLMNLSLGKSTVSKRPAISNVFRTKPILSRSSFVFNNKRTAFWCTDNWVKQEVPLSSRCSSQTSGFVSIAPNELNSSSTSLPDSASSSLCGDLDRASVVSEPITSQLNVGSYVLRPRLGSNLNRPTASNFSLLMSKGSKIKNRRFNGNTIGLFKPIVFNSDQFCNSDLD